MRQTMHAATGPQEKNAEIDLGYFHDFEEVVGEVELFNLTDEPIESVVFSTFQRVTDKQAKKIERTYAEFARESWSYVEGPKKGSSWSPTTFRGGVRSAENAEQVQFLVFDCDKGQPLEEIAERVREAGYATIIASTHSDGVTETSVRRTEWENWTSTNPTGRPAGYMRAKGYHPSVADEAVLREGEHDAEFVTLHHPPCSRCRVMIPVRKPWRRANYATYREGAKAYADGVIEAAAEIGLNIDPAATDLARLYYGPRHPPGRKPRGRLIPGRLAEPWAKPKPVTSDEDFEPLTASDLRRMRKTGLSSEVFAAALHSIPNDATFDDRNAYVAIAASIYHETDGSDDGLALFQEFAARWEGGTSDPEEDERVWRSLDGKSLSATGWTVVHHAKRNGWVPPNEGLADPEAPYGDVWYGRRFAERYRGQLLYMAKANGWREWTGAFWQPVTNERIMQLAKVVSRVILEECDRAFLASPTTSIDETKKAASKVHRSIDRIGKFVLAGRSEDGMFVDDPSAFDSNPDIIALPNGVLDLASLKHAPPRPEHLIGKLAGAEYNADATSPLFDRFLEQVLPDEAVRRLLRALVGYSLSGRVDEEVWVFLYGNGRNGKSVFANILAALFGGYAGTLGTALVTRKKYSEEGSRYLASLPGLRVALVNETGLSDVWAEERMKAMTSREKIAARLLHREPFEFMPTHTLWVRGNHMPGVLDTSDGFWRRMLPIHFNVQIAERDVIPDLDRRIIGSELPGVLNWALAGLKDWQENGRLPVPASVEAQRAAYKADTDLIGEWIEECCKLDPNAATGVTPLYQSYARHCDDVRVRPESRKLFARRMRERGFEQHPDTSRRRWMGIALRSAASSHGPI